MYTTLSLGKHDQGKEEWAPIHVNANKKHQCYLIFIFILSIQSILLFVALWHDDSCAKGKKKKEKDKGQRQAAVDCVYVSK